MDTTRHAPPGHAKEQHLTGVEKSWESNVGVTIGHVFGCGHEKLDVPGHTQRREPTLQTEDFLALLATCNAREVESKAQ